MGRRTVLLIAAVLIAAVGTGLIFAYVSSVNDRALADQSPKKVLVVTRDIAAGTSAVDAEKAGSFELKELASASIPEGSLSDLTPVRDKVALAPIFVGEQVLAAKFGTIAASSGLSLTAGKLAVSIQLADPARVAGFVQPGSEVAIFVTLTGAQPGVPAAQDATRVLLPRAQVIAVGPTTITQTATTSTGKADSGTNVEALPRAILTLALLQVDAQRLIYASQKGQLYFGLLNKDSKVDRGQPVTAANLFG